MTSNKHHKLILMNPGPVNLSPRVREAMSAPDMCHREPEFSELLQDVREKLLQVYGLNQKKYAVVLLTGSGTAAVECAVCGAAGRDDRLLVVSNGVYGERMAAMAQANGIPCEELRLDWGATIDGGAVEKMLRDTGATVLATVHHETTTGVLNDIGEIAELARKNGVRFVVDAVSSFAGEPIDFTDIDFLAGTANKCIQGIPGISFVIEKRMSLPAGEDYVKRGVYLDLKSNLETQEKGIPAFTPAVPSLFALSVALDELLEEGVEKRIERFRARADVVREACHELSLELCFPRERMSSTLTSIMLPAGLEYDTLHNWLKEQGFVIYAGQGGLRERLFRIANMGDISEADMARFAGALKEIVESSR